MSIIVPECCFITPMYKIDCPLSPDGNNYNYCVLSKIIPSYGCYTCGHVSFICILCKRKNRERHINSYGPRFITQMMEHFSQVHQNFYYPISISLANGVVTYPLNTSFWSVRIFDYSCFFYLGYFMAHREKVHNYNKISSLEIFMLHDFERYFLEKEHAAYAVNFMDLIRGLNYFPPEDDAHLNNTPGDRRSLAITAWSYICDNDILQDAMENFMAEYLTLYCALCGKQYAGFPTEEMHFAHLDVCDAIPQ